MFKLNHFCAGLYLIQVVQLRPRGSTMLRFELNCKIVPIKRLVLVDDKELDLLSLFLLKLTLFLITAN